MSAEGQVKGSALARAMGALQQAGLSDKAFMTARDGDLLEKLLVRALERRGRGLRVLEWGAGLSTLYFYSKLRSLDDALSWLTIEHDRGFAEGGLRKAVEELGGVLIDASAESASYRIGLQIACFDEGLLLPHVAGYEHHRLADLREYVSLPTRLTSLFDVVIIDGRHRRRCLVAAQRCLAPDGIVVLHDAERPYYQAGMTIYPDGTRLGDQLWVSKLEHAK